ncbi:hypothetical protein NC658_33525 [Streptomyces griseoincarnatus]|uniref:Transposase n=1 Tax=Streptomyces griseoincarnatus TaxID=29305 RepID=A0ABT0W3D9_STRGI|nr:MULTISPECIES: hypothetical protein [Streptomyces]MBQ1098404.1 hypothetical protein [Streptomyces sp. b94]MCM2518097.1 hypothetical protein [Streptomyces griseoincarnatus]
MDALEHVLWSVCAKWTRPGFEALLELATEVHDRRRLSWLLLRRMMNDQENPLPNAQARALWWFTVAPPEWTRTHGEERNG